MHIRSSGGTGVCCWGPHVFGLTGLSSIKDLPGAWRVLRCDATGVTFFGQNISDRRGGASMEKAAHINCLNIVSSSLPPLYCPNEFVLEAKCFLCMSQVWR